MMIDWKWCENCSYHKGFKIINGHGMVYCKLKERYVYQRSECIEYS